MSAAPSPGGHPGSAPRPDAPADPATVSASLVRARQAFVHACELDVMVRKPGNVSLASAGHGMTATHFLDSAEAAAGPLFAAGAPVGQRIEAAVHATWAVAGCNTNLGILLLCAPVALALESEPAATGRAALAAALEAVLAALTVDDSRAAYRAIARANPGGLGSAPAQDVNAEPEINLRGAMALAADRDRIARQYRDGFREVFELGIQALDAGVARPRGGAPDATTHAAVQRVYLAWLASAPDSHIVRKKGLEAATRVSRRAAEFQRRARAGAVLADDPAFSAWDEELKRQGLNPGTSADLSVVSLMVAGWLGVI